MFVTEMRSEQWIVDRLVQHEGHEIKIELLDDEALVYCDDCQEIIINFFKEGVLD